MSEIPHFCCCCCCGSLVVAMAKGQLILKCPFGVFKSPKKPTKFFSRISALASKKRSNQKKGALNTTNWRILFWLSYTTFLIYLFLEARAEILEKVLLVFWVIWKAPKGHFEINLPLQYFKKWLTARLIYNDFGHASDV